MLSVADKLNPIKIWWGVGAWLGTQLKLPAFQAGTQPASQPDNQPGRQVASHPLSNPAASETVSQEANQLPTQYTL